MSEDLPSITHRFSTAVNLQDTSKYPAFEALSVDDTRTFVVYRATVLDIEVTEGQLRNAAAIAVELVDPENLPAETDPADHLSDFVNAIETASQRS